MWSWQKGKYPMSDAANNALLFEEEIDVRVVEALIKALTDNNRRIAEPMSFLVDLLMRHPGVAGRIEHEVQYQVEKVISHYGVPSRPQSLSEYTISKNPYTKDFSRW